VNHAEHPQTSIYEGRLFVCFVLYLWDPLNWDASNHLLGLFGKLSRRRGAWAWFHDVWTCGAKVLEYEWFLHWKLNQNCSWNFQRNWNVPLVLLERSWWAGFNGIYLVRFGFRLWEILIFEWFTLSSLGILSLQKTTSFFHWTCHSKLHLNTWIKISLDRWCGWIWRQKSCPLLALIIRLNQNY
jgi:hypothetical protein